jgi:hypothetical protein
MECGTPTRETFDYNQCEGWTVCPGCRTIEGRTEEITLEEYESSL